MFRRNFKNNLKNKIIRNSRFINNIFDLIKVTIDFDNKLYKRVIIKALESYLKKSKNLF